MNGRVYGDQVTGAIHRLPRHRRRLPTKPDFLVLRQWQQPPKRYRWCHPAPQCCFALSRTSLTGLTPRYGTEVLSQRLERTKMRLSPFRPYCVRPSAGPRPARWRGCQSGAHRVHLYITQRTPAVRFIERAGKEAVLPHVAAPAVTAVQRQRILGVGVAQSSGQRVRALGDGDQVDMVCHQTVAEDSCAVMCGVPRQGIQVEPAVIGRVENRLAIVPALRNMVSDTRKNNSRAAGHTHVKWRIRSRSLTKMRLSPFGHPSFSS